MRLEFKETAIKKIIYWVLAFIAGLLLLAGLNSCSAQLTNTIGNRNYKIVDTTRNGYIIFKHHNVDFYLKGNIDSVPVLSKDDVLVRGDYLVFE